MCRKLSRHLPVDNVNRYFFDTQRFADFAKNMIGDKIRIFRGKNNLVVRQFIFIATIGKRFTNQISLIRPGNWKLKETFL